ncbi:hypothetical protein ACFVW2_26105 [Streptomyces sp. NPDC058171]
MNDNTFDQLSRRDAFKLGSGLAAGLAVGGSGVLSTSAFAAPGAAPTGATSLPVSKSFDLNHPSEPVFMHRPAWCETIMQSSGYDHLNQHWYVIQVMYNPDDGVPYATRKKEGDLAITKLSADGATKLGRMYLRGFGHGAQIGVEPTAAGSAPYIWVEYESHPDANETGYGAKVCRIKYLGAPTGQPPRSFHWTSAADKADMDFKDRTPLPGQLPGPGSTVTAPRPFVDIHHRRVMVRFGRNGATQCGVWDLDDAIAAPLGTPLHHVAALPRPTPAYASQGFSFYGSYMYMYEGGKYAAGGPAIVDDLGTTHITKVNLNTGVWERKLTRALKSLTIREPEGMAIKLVPDAAGPGGYRAQLCFGFGSGVSNDHRVNLAYKDLLV